MITCEERKNRLLKANNLMKRLNLNSILVVGNGSVATNEYGFYRYFVDNRVYYHRQALVIVADETPTVCCGSLTHLKALNERGFWDVRMVGDRLAEGLVDILGSRGITNGRIGYCPETLPASWFDCIHSASSLDIPQYILYYAMPVGFGLMVFWSIVNIVMDIKKIRNGDAGLDESDSVSMKTE